MNNRPTPGNRKPSICFVSPNNYAVLSGRDDLGHIGGSEIQQPMIARELLQRGYRVSFITLDHGQPDGIEHDGIRVHKMCARSDGIPGLRFIHPRWTSLCRAMSRANAEVYYQMNNGVETGQCAMWCHRHNRVFVFAVSSDSNCKDSLPGLQTRRERLLYRFGLRSADLIISQTRIQQEMLRKDMGVESVVIRSCSFDPYAGASAIPPRGFNGRHRLLWVGRVSPEKRLELFLDLAEECPEYACDVVGAAFADSAYSRNMLTRATSMTNVVLHGRVPHDAVGEFYERSSLLFCTSSYEGFPNTFMEAWARGVPTISTVDPDGMIVDDQLGSVCHDPGSLATATRRLLTDSSQLAEHSRRVRKHYLAHFTVEKTVDALVRSLTHSMGHV